MLGASRRFAGFVTFTAPQTARFAAISPVNRVPSRLAAGCRRSPFGAFEPVARSALPFSTSTAAGDSDKVLVEQVRNIGISAHIDSGKTTLTERILFYTGRIAAMHEVRGKDGVGAKMDSMELERERGITIQSAATYTKFGDLNINIIDTPGHVDFTIEVERALRVLDGAVLVLCAVGGVQSQTFTVNRQMNRYNVPCIAFINKMDRIGASHTRVLGQLKEKLEHNAECICLPIGAEDELKGLVDVVSMEAVYFGGDHGEVVRRAAIPSAMAAEAAEARAALVGAVADADEELAELFLNEEEPSVAQLKAAIRRATVAKRFTPVMMGSAIKNCGVQTLLEAVGDYMPSPADRTNLALDKRDEKKKVPLRLDAKSDGAGDPFVGLAFKLEDGKYGQLTYMRVYQGVLRRNDPIFNTRTDSKMKTPRLVRMHSDEMEDVQAVAAGEICAMFGVECSSGDTFAADAARHLSMETMFVPNPVISLSITPKEAGGSDKFDKAISRFTREDPTFRCTFDNESKETIISGMGELHLNVYAERIKREYNCDVIVGKPRVAFRETLTQPVRFDYTHKKQSGGAGQFAKVIGKFEPLTVEEDNMRNDFVNECMGSNIPHNFFAAIEKGWSESCQKGHLTGYPVLGMRMIIQDGGHHIVDSSELAFKLAVAGAIRDVWAKGAPTVYEPVMRADVVIPGEFQGDVMAGLAKRHGSIIGSETGKDFCSFTLEVPLNNMFGYSTELRTQTQGKGEFAMEFLNHQLAPPMVIEQLKKEYEAEQKARMAAKGR